MGWSSRLILVSADDGLHRLPGTAFTRMLKAQAPCRAPAFAGQRVRLASVAVELSGGVAMGVRNLSFSVLHFDDHGQLDVHRLNIQHVARLDKGTALLDIKAVVAKSFERIHRSNLIGMGVLPLQFKADDGWESLGLKGDEVVDVVLGSEIKPLSDATLRITAGDGSVRELAVTLRIDTAIEVDYYKHGGILPFVLRQLLAA
ncbi:MAG: hypothetical protein KF683_04845 [Rubrivivax sp.]|nr:hypothetical protein [Rubrivivax sp.]